MSDTNQRRRNWPKPIEDYAFIGDLHTGALISRDGSIDWLCLPRFDSGACFAALLHDDSAGHWRLAPRDPDARSARRYEEDTLVLRTRWETDSGTIDVVDLMSPRDRTPDVVRIVEGVDGEVEFESRLRLRFDYGEVRPWIRVGEGTPRDVTAIAGPDAVRVTSDLPLDAEDGDLTTRFTVRRGDRRSFVLAYGSSHEPFPDPTDPDHAVAEARDFWRGWIKDCTYRGRWSEEVRRALILLKSLIYAPTGGVVAAATTSLPEDIGGVRNWDYRYCWLRDSAMTLEALIGTGHIEEAKAWREWLVRAVAGDPAGLQIAYGLEGERRLPEILLDRLSGYAGSSPVRIGNAAAGQRQLDVWGETLDGLYVARDAGLGPATDAWEVQRALMDWLESNWREPDSALWEMRGEPRHYVHSKVTAWAGVDRMIRTVERHRKDGLDGPVDRWRRMAKEIHDEVCQKGFDTDRGTFTQFYGSRGLDAALLLIPQLGFLPWDDERVRGTVRAVERELLRDGFLMRYDPQADGNPDGLPGSEGAFIACSFWLADALHGIGEYDRAEEHFTRLLELRNDVGMLSEEWDPHANRALGNTPQAFSMVALVNTARRLSTSPRGHS